LSISMPIRPPPRAPLFPTRRSSDLNLTQAVEFWHSSTIWAGQGQCTAVFSFDSGLHDITDLRVAVKALSPNGEIVLEGELAIDQFGQSSAERYADAFL